MCDVWCVVCDVCWCVCGRRHKYIEGAMVVVAGK